MASFTKITAGAAIAALSVALITAGQVPLAQAQSRSDNVRISYQAFNQLRYSKTIDFTEAPDNTEIPDAEFTFVASQVADDEAAGIGTTYTFDEFNTLEVRKGELATPVILSKVQFAAADEKQEADQRMARVRDAYTAYLAAITSSDSRTTFRSTAVRSRGGERRSERSRAPVIER